MKLFIETDNICFFEHKAHLSSPSAKRSIIETGVMDEHLSFTHHQKLENAS